MINCFFSKGGKFLKKLWYCIGGDYRDRTGHGKPGKSWNLIISFSRPGKSSNLGLGHGKSWKISTLSSSERQ